SGAAAGAKWDAAPGFGVILTDQPGAASWPIAGATFILMHKVAANAGDSNQTLKFFAWAYAKGGKMAEELDYVPMPAPVVSAIEAMWAKSFVGSDGKPLRVTSN